MDENHQILKTHTFTPGELPESLQPLAETAYILTEEQTASDTHRALYQSEVPPLLFRRVIHIPAEKPVPARKD